jgi:hypothetical protein
MIKVAAPRIEAESCSHLSYCVGSVTVVNQPPSANTHRDEGNGLDQLEDGYQA